MNSRLLAAIVFSAALVSASRAAEEPETTKSSAMEALRARAAEEAKKKPVTPPSPQPLSPPAPQGATEQKAEKKTPATATAAVPTKQEKSAAKTADQPATVLPKVEVKKGRITELDQQIAKQEQDIAREKKNIKPSEVDLALNDSKVAQPLAIFGGESAQFRKRVASERVELMEAEKDILEAMKLSKTKAEKEKLQKELDELRAMRRELEKSLR